MAKIIFDFDLQSSQKYGVAYAVLEQMHALQALGQQPVNFAAGLSGAWAFLETFFAAISSFISESAEIHKDVGISAQRALVYSTITKVLSFVSLGINIGNILANPNLSLTQQILEIICHITAVWASGAIIAAAAGPLGILGGLLASIFISLVITGLLLLAIHCIENCANFRRKSIFYV